MEIFPLARETGMSDRLIGLFVLPTLTHETERERDSFCWK